MKDLRHDNELAEAISEWGWKFHHLGIPTNEKRVGERYLPELKFFISGFETSPFGIEWMRFESDCKMHRLIQEVPHLAFEVEDLDYELATRNFNVLEITNSPSENVRVAMIEHNGAPIELIEFQVNKT